MATDRGSQNTGSPNSMMGAMANSMRERTGRTVEQWLEVIGVDGPDPLDQKAMRAWLKKEHGLAQNTQWTLADAAARQAGWAPPTVDEYVDQLYSGKKAALRPLHDRVSALILSLGDDVRAEGRGTYIPFVRNSQFAAVAPGPRGQLRVGVRLRRPEDLTRLLEDVQGAGEGDSDGERSVVVEEAKNFAQATHWVHLVPEVDAGPQAATEPGAALEPLLRAAYDQN